jgi:hypothetical protein
VSILALMLARQPFRVGTALSGHARSGVENELFERGPVTGAAVRTVHI